MTVFRRFAIVAVAGVVFAVAAAAQEKKDKADSQVPTADLTPVWVVMDHAMDGTGGIQSGYGTSTYDVSSGATATDLKVEPVGPRTARRSSSETTSSRARRARSTCRSSC